MRVHVEAVDADAAGALKGDQLGPCLVRDVVELEPAVGVGMLLGLFEQRDVARLDAEFFGQLGVIRLAAEQLLEMRAGAGQRLGLATDAAVVALGLTSIKSPTTRALWL
jgi:hypothetical protein